MKALMKRKPSFKTWVKNRRVLLLIALAAALALASLFAAVTRREEAEVRGEYAPITKEEIAYALSVDPPKDASRRALVEAAVSLVDTVHYFWGGKSTAVGRDAQWGVMKEVTSSGSRTTGTMRPYGLDCSGFVLWCFVQLGYGADEAEALVGIGTWMQGERSYDIEWSELAPGDFVFENRYPSSDGNHIGICIGYNAVGQPVFAHCSSKYDNVVVTPAGGVFRYARRPFLFYAEEGGLSP